MRATLVIPDDVYARAKQAARARGVSLSQLVTDALAGLKPGQPAPRSGRYVTIGPRGGHGPEVTAVQGMPLPPAPKRGSTYRLAEPTDNGAGRDVPDTTASPTPVMPVVFMGIPKVDVADRDALERAMAE
jgi:hypothetical protein